MRSASPSYSTASTTRAFRSGCFTSRAMPNMPTPTPGLGSPQGAVVGAHFFLQDKSGKSLVVEPVDGTLKVHDAPLGVMTNAPTYDWHMTNLSNYVNLSVKDID